MPNFLKASLCLNGFFSECEHNLELHTGRWCKLWNVPWKLFNAAHTRRFSISCLIKGKCYEKVDLAEIAGHLQQAWRPETNIHRVIWGSEERDQTLPASGRWNKTWMKWKDVHQPTPASFTLYSLQLFHPHPFLSRLLPSLYMNYH